MNLSKALKHTKNILLRLRFPSFLFLTSVLLLFELFLTAPSAVEATLTITPLTWNVIGLDSNSPTTGPKYFPVGARVCSSALTTSVAVAFTWDSTNANVDLRAGSLGTSGHPFTITSIAAGACSDAYFEVGVNQVSAAYDTTRRYHITATDTSGVASTPTPRDLYVEHLISQNRNSITGVKLDGTSIPAGGSMNLMVGNTYTIELDGGTATQGYNQFEAFINLPNTIFQILSVSTTYSADNSPYVRNPNDKLYADACLWDPDVNNSLTTYRSCVGGDYKAGGSTVVTTYTVKILSGSGVTTQTLNTLLYDFSGSSFHYNGDYSTGARIANVIDPASSLSISKAFAPSSTVAGGTSTLTFTITNAASESVSGANFNDSLPLLSGGQMVVATPATYSTSGCGSPTFTPVAGASSVSFSSGTVAANSSCVVSVAISVPSTPTTGTYANTSNNLFVGTLDTGHSASASLALTTTTAGSGICSSGTLASWTVPTGTTANPPDLSGGIPTSKASNVPSAAAFANLPASTAIVTNTGQGDTTSWETYGYKTAGQYIEFDVDTSNYTSVSMSFYVTNPGGGNGPSSLVLSYDKGSGFTTALTITNPASVFTLHTVDFTGLTNTAGVTKFRLTATGANQDTAVSQLNYDNISFSGTTCSAPTQPTITKTFLTNPIAVNGTSTLQFTLTNSNATQLTVAKFTDALPSGLAVAATPSASTTCTGSPTWAPAVGATSLAFGQTTGATIPASGSCTVSVNVTATTAGPHTNVSGFISTTESGTNSGAGGSATASITAVQSPSMTKHFGSNPILAGGTSLLTFTISNPNPNNVLSGIAFSDTYPSGLVNADLSATPVTNSCSGSITASTGASSISLSGGTLAAGASCTVSVTVTAPTASSYANTSGTVSATTAGTGSTATDTLVVNAPRPSISLLKQVGPTATGPWSPYLSVSVGGNVYYRFTVENTGDVPLSPISITDATVSVSSCNTSWASTTLPVAVASNNNNIVSCVVGPVTAVSGSNANTAHASGTYSSTVYSSANSIATYATTDLTLVKSGVINMAVAGSSLVADAGDTITYSFSLTNTGVATLTSITVTDPLLPSLACTVASLTSGVTASCTPTNNVYTLTAADVAAGQVMNLATASTGSVSATSRLITSMTSSDLWITKTDGVTSINSGASTSYTITVTNNGPSSVTGAILSDAAATGLTKTAVVCSSTPGQCSSAPSVAQLESGTFALPALTSGQTYQITIAATVTAGSGSVTNTASVTPPGGTTNPGTNCVTGSGITRSFSDGTCSSSDVDTVNATTYTVTAQATGNGTGTVASNTGSISYTYQTASTGTTSAINYGTNVVLTATAGTGSTVSWTTCTGTTGGTTAAATCTFSSLDGTKTAQATFTLNTYTVTATATGNGTGTVASNTGGISYTYQTASTGTTSAINYGTNVVLTATAGTGSTVSWTTCTGTTGGTTAAATCTFSSLDGTKTAQATFTLNTYTVTATATGNGTGTVASNTGGISYTYQTASTGTTSALNYGTNVVLTATAGTGSTVSWTTCTGTTGGTTAAATCTFSSLDGTKTAQATFTLNTYTVTATATGNGTGTVASNTGGISYTYQTASTGTTSAINYGTSVTLTATAGTGSTVSWTTCTGTTGGTTAAATCTYTSLDGTKTAQATFTLNTYTVTATATGNGTGTVASNTGGISYTYQTASTGTTSAINYGTSVTLTATAGTGSTVSWTTCTGTTGGTTAAATCTYTSLDGTKTAQATFTLNTYTVTYNGNTNTGGTAPTDSSSPYNYNSTVTVLGNTGPLTKTGYTFANWNTAANGTGTSYAAAATFTISVNTTLYAQWTINTYTVTVTATATASGNGTGTVASNTGGISYTYPTASTGTTSALNYGTNVVLTATAGTGSTVSWSGTCTTAGGIEAGNSSGTATCTIASLTANKTVAATFTLNTYTVTATASGNGTGTVASNTGGISYTYPTASTGTTSALNYGTNVVLTATAGTGSTVSWSGTCITAGGIEAGNSSGTATCTIAGLTANKTVAATFTLNTYTVTATASGNGTGTVASNTGGISYTYPTAITGTTSALNYGTNVVVTATAGTGSTVSWSGTCTTAGGIEAGNGSGTATCTFSSLTATKSITATFTITVAGGSIAGSIWYDLNGNHIRDSNEAGRSGWHVELLSGGVILATTITDTSGDYIFSGLQAGTYAIRFINPNGADLSSGPMPVNGENGSPVSGGGTPSLSKITDITLTADSSGRVSSVPQQSLPLDPSGVIYNSTTRQPVSGATVTLLYNGTAINTAYVAGASATQTTSSDGSYAFFILPGAPAGTYGLSVSAANYTFPSTAIPPTTAPGGFTGGAVTSISGAPQTGQDTKYYLQFNRPTTDMTNNNIPLDPVQSNAVPVAVPTMTEWGMIIFMILAGLMAIYFIRKQKALS